LSLIVQDVNYYKVDDLHVHRLVSRYHNSNTFIAHSFGSAEVIIVDPGDPDTSLIVEYLNAKEFDIHSVWLTHEHSDHCAGINALYTRQAFPIYCTAICAQNVLNPKRNFSAYIDEIETFIVHPATTAVGHKCGVNFGGKEIIVLSTPGHTKGSACFILGSTVFSGDTLMKDYKTPLNFPGSDKVAYQNSIRTLLQNLKSDSYIFPGHGNPFALSEYSLSGG